MITYTASNYGRECNMGALAVNMGLKPKTWASWQLICAQKRKHGLVGSQYGPETGNMGASAANMGRRTKTWAHRSQHGPE
ncbi:hypothetical protein [Lentibacillus sp. CBA3610]|uniref:hypothetical protein n=1 Tax=Lentibacillus sp. CBA3610 TaxID=2518176 RepID=UPI00159597EB|nr:hypothetical protein [Lentibacillus sp. CBA3610]QKY71158.1 hypothetical protein Len3610_17755 [Lentibacillus sp. CBA3610]